MASASAIRYRTPWPGTRARASPRREGLVLSVERVAFLGPRDLAAFFSRAPERAGLPGFEQLLPVEAEDPHERRDERRPAGLMSSTHARAVVAMEVLVEEHVVAPVRVGLQLLRTP